MDGCKRFLHFALFSPPKLVSREKTIDQKSLVLILIYIYIYSLFKDRVAARLPMGFSWTMFFFQDVTEHCTLARSADSPLFVCRDHSTPPLLGSKHGMGPLGFRWSYADNFGLLARGADCTNVHLARLIAGLKKVRLDVHDISLATGNAENLG